MVWHAQDDGVWLAGVEGLDDLPADVDAVVSLCKLGSDQVPAVGVRPNDHVEVWLVDYPDPAHNPNRRFVLHDAVDALEALRTEGPDRPAALRPGPKPYVNVAALYGAPPHRPSGERSA